MEYEIVSITLTMPFRMGSVNCYLIRGDDGFVLIDTGVSHRRRDLVQALRRAGCMPGTLMLILLTHGDFDHTGNAAYLRDTFDARIAMHPGDRGMAELGDMFCGRRTSNALVRLVVPVLSGFGKKQRFSPDLEIVDGVDLIEYGLDARVLDLPGHSQGSIGVLTGVGDLFCGDMFTAIDKPERNSLMDDGKAFEASFERLRALGVRTVYPGHGTAFAWHSLVS
ncbi:MAG: MBL fold metallo-hydrolase [Anaerolineae bacterium]|nr:MBL fold metallo-hydrolase [Anaerolineae bacterium]